jgi:hypothetical protein
MQVVYAQTENVRRTLHVENPNDFFSGFTIQTTENHTPTIESVKALRDLHVGGKAMKHVARVPLTIVEQALREGWFNDQAKWKRWLNEPDNKVFRVWEGAI